MVLQCFAEESTDIFSSSTSLTMDRGTFYTREVPLPCSQAAGINVTPVLPYTYNHLQAPFGAGPESSCLPDIGLVQKLDQVLYLLREQSKETSVIRVELRSLTADVKELQESSRSASTSSSTQSTTPPAPPRKIPTELSVKLASISVCFNVANLYSRVLFRL